MKKKNRKTRKLPERSLLHKLFEFNFDTGKLIWKEGSRKGKEAGYQTKLGYTIVGIKQGNQRIEYKAHRLIYYMFTGDTLTKKVVDHIDGNRSNNRLNNLRAVTHRKNLQNTAQARANGIVPSADKKLAFYI